MGGEKSRRKEPEAFLVMCMELHVSNLRKRLNGNMEMHVLLHVMHVLLHTRGDYSVAGGRLGQSLRLQGSRLDHYTAQVDTYGKVNVVLRLLRRRCSAWLGLGVRG